MLALNCMLRSQMSVFPSDMLLSLEVVARKREVGEKAAGAQLTLIPQESIALLFCFLDSV